MRKIIFLGILLLLAGCSTGKTFSRGDLESQIGVKTLMYDEKDIRDEFAKRPNLPKPFKLGVYLKKPPAGSGDVTWRWTEQDKTVLEEVLKNLKERGLVADVFPILNSLTENEDLKSIRMVAARHQADAVMIVSGAGDTDRYTNKWAWTYLFIVPALFVPASHAETMFVTSATLWDVRTDYLYLTAEAEGSSKDTYAAAFGKPDRDILEEAKTRSMTNLKAEIERAIKGVTL